MSDASALIDERLLKLLRSVDPLAAEPPVCSDQTEVALQRLVATMRERPGSAPGDAPKAHPPGRLLLAGACAVAAATLIVLLGLGGGGSVPGGGTRDAGIAWASAPTSPLPGQVATAEAACERVEADLAGQKSAIADTRGSSTLLVYLRGHTNDMCLAGRSGAAGTVAGEASEEIPAPGRIVVQLVGGGPGLTGNQAYFVDGTVNPAVTGVALVLEDGTKVHATVAAGWFAAWWPGHERATSAEITAGGNTATQPLTLPTATG